MAHYGRKPTEGTQLVRSCGNPMCVNPLHLKEATAADMWEDPDLPRKRQGSIGSLKVGSRVLSAQEVFNLQDRYHHPDPRKGLAWHFRYALGVFHLDNPTAFDLRPRAQRELDIIRVVRRCPIRATRTVLPCGFIRFDLPPGITEIAFTEPPPLTYEEAFGPVDDEDDPEDAPAAVWAVAA